MAGKYKKESGARTGGRSSPIDYTGTDEELGPLGAVDPIVEVGRHLTPTSVAEMKRLVVLGVPVPTAATAIGAGSRARHWATKARQDRAAGLEPGWEHCESAELYWLEAMEAAKAQFEGNMVSQIAVHAAGDWKAAAWLLERRASRRWHMTHKLTVEAGQGKQLEVTSMSTEKLLRIAKGLLPEESIKETLALPSGDVTDGEIVEDDVAQQEP